MDACRPGRRLRVLVAAIEILLNGNLELVDACNGETPNLTGREFAEQALHLIQPRGRRGNEVELNAWMLASQAWTLGCLRVP